MVFGMFSETILVTFPDPTLVLFIIRETSDVIAKVAFKMFLGINAEVTSWNAENTVFSLVFNENPFVDFVELPPQYSELQVRKCKYKNFPCHTEE